MLLPEHGLYPWMERGRGKQMHLTSHGLHVSSLYTQDSPQLRFQWTALGRRLNSQGTDRAHQSLELVSAWGKLSVGPFRGQCHQPLQNSDSRCPTLVLPLTCVRLTCVWLQPHHLPSLGLSFLNYSESTEPHQGCGRHCNSRIKCTTQVVTARRAVL